MNDDELEVYGDSGVTSGDKKIEKWLKVLYIILPFWGILWMCFYWNGSYGWLDRGYWNQLEKGANTMYPKVNYNSKK